MSLCDRCYAPGACCKNLWIRFYRMKDDAPIPTLAEAQQALFDATEADNNGSAMPWIVKQVLDTPEFVHVKCDCTALLPNGRCGVYERRPEACRNYQPQSDGLCIHFYGTESGDPTFDGELFLTKDACGL